MVHFLAPHGCLTSSMQQDVWPPLLTAQPRRTQSGGASMTLTLPQPHAETPGCYPTLLLNFSPAQTYVHPNKGQKQQEQTHF
ncbi:hypothetical protein CesoFtcFv8_011666 [Champsocephalus esox]|uniref:Uncharacterized protein n=2 Tax=Champsocephalus TaxID=52236 RepID=A0AAN8DPU4_CHAGU|nr:hypothetical protein CesoFtcFv8_011666 [Champsocephalus esox]KAK5924060.1 hypothetical protein CgunFtcFv8_000968 [Champsocephalus gunnari]